MVGNRRRATAPRRAAAGGSSRLACGAHVRPEAVDPLLHGQLRQPQQHGRRGRDRAVFVPHEPDVRYDAVVRRCRKEGTSTRRHSASAQEEDQEAL